MGNAKLTGRVLNQRWSWGVAAAWLAIAIAAGVWYNDHAEACKSLDDRTISTVATCFLTRSVNDILSLHGMQGWALLRNMLVYNTLVLTFVTLSVTVAAVAMHYRAEYLAARGDIVTVGGVENPPLTTYDIIRFIAYAPVSGYPVYAHMLWAFGGGKLVLTPPESVLEVLAWVALIPAGMVVYDTFQYMGHRWMHTSRLRWVRQIHAHHHATTPQREGMIVTDLMSVNPLEYWFIFNPGVMVLLEVWQHAVPLLGLRPSYWGYMTSFVAIVLTALRGHLNYDNDTAPFFRRLGFVRMSDHAMHHHNPTKNFANFFTFLDDWCGTYGPYPGSSEGWGAGRIVTIPCAS